jgi:hypothetical protein
MAGCRIILFGICLLHLLLLRSLSLKHSKKFGDAHRECSQRLMSSQWRAVCLDSKDKSSPTEAPCKAYFKDMVSSPKIAWFIQCMAKVMIDRGFQIPVYVVHDGKPDRFKNIYTECKSSTKINTLQCLLARFYSHVTSSRGHSNRSGYQERVCYVGDSI